MIKPPQRLCDWNGATVKLIHETRNSLATLPAGTTGKIRVGYKSRNGLTFISNPCECCGVQLHITRMRPEDFELLELVQRNAGEEQ
ncbi:TPA_asm: hypothetical protein GBZ53_06710 [Salmonella enterica subsp. enterica]|uniref:Uncharacterized protein n=1 Tax=Salmonella enterica I TaxID=59201 RepID=A0A6Y2V0B3_SALET|nr:hypothetical protein [Salmonella enterica]HAB1649500.1 hypothetical protein [Salmonella enterica subsp. enterica]EHW1978079.1 hypothetical protein [Salmonella enterica subsp. enterica serovar Agona]MDQ7445010.1 hypothetical protein [Salmonella enterica subsp. enterica serovar Agona]MDQ7465715.1 hypothetical protein [Salmonella enterica subsp. enterica serovar Agona]MDQ7484332.1 hypothetical protein [Salmonella enterica subsp. enterica serovar Agona]